MSHSNRGLTDRYLKNFLIRFDQSVQDVGHTLVNQLTPDKLELLEEQAQASRPILHHRLKTLIKEFLAIKRGGGTAIEKEVYAFMSEAQFIDRLLTQRPYMFMTSQDQYMLRDGTTGSGKFEFIGTENEALPLVLKDYLSYDEMQIAALFGLSSPTNFINNGNRHNRGIVTDPANVQPSGISIGLVGARLEKPNVMEWQHVIVTGAQNTAANGYGLHADKANVKACLIDMWEKFYGVGAFSTFNEVNFDASGKYIKLNENTYFNCEVYKERIRITIETFLLEADARAKQTKQLAYVHAVGFGLGVWQLDAIIQTELMLEVYAETFKRHTLENISDVNFSWFNVNNCDGVQSGEYFIAQNGNKIRIHFSKREPAQKLIDNDADKLLVCAYAWDGNSYIGNEFWRGMLTASGDPAAASCSYISLLQNPEINSHIRGDNTYFLAHVNENRSPVLGGREDKEEKFDAPVIQAGLYGNDDILPLIVNAELKILSPCRNAALIVEEHEQDDIAPAPPKANCITFWLLACAATGLSSALAFLAYTSVVAWIAMAVGNPVTLGVAIGLGAGSLLTGGIALKRSGLFASPTPANQPVNSSRLESADYINNYALGSA